ncbi:MAG: dihydrolipoyl dehydrogenase family protein [Verrucomicrobiota bacterium]
MSEPTQHFDYIVIGGGSGGYAAARTARETLDRVAIVDGADTLGGLCILRGCMPSKTLIYCAEVLHLAQMGERFGLKVPEARPDMQAMHRRKLKLIDEFAKYRQEQLESDRFTLFRNRARFVGPDQIQLDDGTRLTADHFMVATGSSPSVPTVPGLADVPYWTSDDVLDLDFVPPKVIVLGGGVVACELAQFLGRIGGEVVQIQRSPHILKEVSAEAATVIERKFLEEGIELYTDTQLLSVAYADGDFTVTFLDKGEPHTVRGPHLMNALGRHPAVKGLGLDAAGVETRSNGQIICDPMQCTTNPRIYACGDVAGPYEIVHTAIMQGEVGALHATGRRTDPVDYDTLSRVIFTDPQIAAVGLTDAELKEKGIDYISAAYPMNDHGKTLLMEAIHGYVKVFADKQGTVLGAECVGRDGGELMHTMAVAVSLRAKVGDLLKVHWYHPTVSEIWAYPLEDIAQTLGCG